MNDLEDVLDRIRKLLALSKSPNEHEAALAAARAAELMIRYQLTEEQIGEEEARLRVGEHELARSAKVVVWKTTIAGGLAKSMGCEMLVGTFGSLDKQDKVIKGSKEIRLVIVGRDSDFAVIHYMFAYFCAEVDRLAADAYAYRSVQRQAPNIRAYKNAFRAAAAQRIKDRLIAQRKTTRADAQAAGMSLVRLDQIERATREYIDATASCEPKGYSSSSSDISGFIDGARAGELVDLGQDKTKITAGDPRLPARSTR